MFELSRSEALSPPCDRHRVVATPRGLSSINRATVDLCIWKRSFSVGLSSWLDTLALRHTFSFELRGVLSEDVDFEQLLSTVPTSDERAAWCADLHQVLSQYSRVVGREPLRVQLGIVDSRKCPRFHVDNVGVRLLCTYAGTGTEWIRESQLDRNALRSCPAMQAPTKPNGRVDALDRFDVALMKGSAFPGNGRFGTVHRSPEVSRAPRIVLTVDTSRPTGR